jgi:hypothetical protein
VEEEQGLPGGIVPTSYRMRPAIAALGTPVPVSSRARALLQGRERKVRVCKLEWQVASAPGAIQLARLEQPMPRDEPVRLARPIQQAATTLGRPRPFTTTMAYSSFSYAADHSCLIGYLYEAPEAGTWCIRYAVPEQKDVHGGSLKLVNPGAFGGLRSGQLVRVEGQLIAPAPHEIKPAYFVRGLQTLQP